MGEVLKLDNVTSLYSDNKGIKNITFEIKEGEFVALIGHNGAGKTTLMNTILATNDYTGEIYIKYLYNDISYVSQKQVIDWYLTVEDNIFMEQNILDRCSKKQNEEIISLFSLNNILKDSVENLSGGQLQRVSVARALLKYPKLYILDEPTTGLDVYSSEKVLKYLKKMSQEKKTVVISSHDLELVEKYVDRIIIISNGEITYDGKIKDFTNISLREAILKELVKNNE